MNVEEERIEDWISTTVKRFVDLVERHGLNVDVEARHLEAREMVRPSSGGTWSSTSCFWLVGRVDHLGHHHHFCLDNARVSLCE